MSAIFISHSAKDHADTAAITSWLKKQGHTSYFIDYDEKFGIRAGTDWAQVLYQRLRQCQAIVALVTPDWLESKWCFGEMVMALEKGKPIFPVKLKSCELPGLLSGIQSIDLTVDKDGGYRRLAAGLKQQGLDPADLFVPDPRDHPILDFLPLRKPTPRSSSAVVPIFCRLARPLKDCDVIAKACRVWFWF